MATMIALKKITAGDNIRRIEGVEDFLNTPLSEFPERERQTILSLANEQIHRNSRMPVKYFPSKSLVLHSDAAYIQNQAANHPHVS